MGKKANLVVLVVIWLLIAGDLAWAAPMPAPANQLARRPQEPMSIILISPVGGEKLTPAGNLLIRWTFKGNPGTAVDIFLMQGTTKVRTLALNHPLASGQFNWNIGNDAKPGADYSILIQSKEHPAVLTRSNLFLINQMLVSAAMTHGPMSAYIPEQVTVLDPKQGGTWKAGDPQEIDWQYNGDPPGQAKVLLMKGTQVVSTIDAGRSWGQYGKGYILPYYMPSTTPPAAGYFVKVVSTTDDRYRGTGGQFTILPYCRLIVTQPANNAPLANWPVGSVQTLAWTYSGDCGAHVKVELHGGVNDNNKIYLLVASWPIGPGGAGSFQWTVPPSGANGINWIPGNQYQITITGIENPQCWDWTGKFTVGQ